MSYPEKFEDLLADIDQEQLLREIGEEELARQADMLDLLQKKEATVEDGQLHSSSMTLADPGHLGKFFEPGGDADPGAAAVADEPGGEMTPSQPAEEVSQEEEPFDCSAEIVPYDVDGELVSVWNELQGRVEHELETFSQTFIADAFKLVLELSSGMQRLHEETRLQLEDIVANIREEEGRHAHGVALMNDYYKKMESMLEVMRHPIRKV